MALPNDLQRTAKLIAAQNAADPNFTNSPTKGAARLIRRTYTFPGVTAAVNANASNAVLANSNPAIRMPVAGRLLGAYAVFTGNATANDTNNATLAIKILNSDGTVGNSAASITTATSANGGTGNVVLGQGVTVTVVAANQRFTAGSFLAPQVSQNSSGVAMSAGSWTIDVEEEDVDSYPVT